MLVSRAGGRANVGCGPVPATKTAAVGFAAHEALSNVKLDVMLGRQ
jgi:hypothetical protein